MLFALENRQKMTELGNRGYLYNLNGDVPNIEEHCKMLEQIYQNVSAKRRPQATYTFPNSVVKSGRKLH